MTPTALLLVLRSRGVLVTAAGEQLRVRAARGTLDQALTATLRGLRLEVLELLRLEQAWLALGVEERKRFAAELAAADPAAVAVEEQLRPLVTDDAAVSNGGD